MIKNICASLSLLNGPFHVVLPCKTPPGGGVILNSMKYFPRKRKILNSFMLSARRWDYIICPAPRHPLPIFSPAVSSPSFSTPAPSPNVPSTLHPLSSTLYPLPSTFYLLSSNVAFCHPPLDISSEIHYTIRIRKHQYFTKGGEFNEIPVYGRISQL